MWEKRVKDVEKKRYNKRWARVPSTGRVGTNTRDERDRDLRYKGSQRKNMWEDIVNWWKELPTVKDSSEVSGTYDN